ncbi:MAG: GGDEF domain-containing protein [Acidobacteriota bacterium]|nr:GGDEF domain-containing protein [Acidobacteriota bacterium]
MASDHIIQLNLSDLRAAGAKGAPVHSVWLIDQLLEVIAENVAVEDTERSNFRTQLESLRGVILESGANQVPGSIALETLDLCRGQFKQTQTKRLEREEHFAEIIAFLRNSLVTLTGDSRTFHEDLLGTTDRIKALIGMKDIQELKARIAAEVNALNQAVLEKQKREQNQFAQLSARISILQKKLEEAKVEASLDGLTGIANRRYFDFTLQRWIVAHEKSEEPFVVALFDLDNFKQINDNYGHQVGDQVLTATAVEISRSIRSSDFLARYGGEEFVVLSSGMRLAEAQKRFAALLRHIEEMRFDCLSAESESLTLALTCSCGVAEYALGESAKDMISRADEALYEAKRSGKNRVVVKRRPLLSAFYEGRKRTSLP